MLSSMLIKLIIHQLCVCITVERSAKRAHETRARKPNQLVMSGHMTKKSDLLKSSREITLSDNDTHADTRCNTS